MKPKVVPPANARYRCGFPGCTKRYVSTDGVRKHARKMHNDWLRTVDVHSVFRDKSYESKPSTYCIMESGEGGDDHSSLFDPTPRAGNGAPAPTPAMSANATDEILRRGGGGLAIGNAGGGFVPNFMTPEAMLLSALTAARTGNPVLDALTMGRQLSLPQAMNLHALFKDNPIAREQWAHIAAALLANPPAVEPEAPVPSSECFTPLVNAAVPTYDTPLQEGKRGGDISPFALDKANPASKPASPEHPPTFGPLVPERPSPEPPILSGQPPAPMINQAMLSAVPNASCDAKAGVPSPSMLDTLSSSCESKAGVPSPLMLDTLSKPSSLGHTAAFDTAAFDSDSDVNSDALDTKPADLLDLGDVDCDAFLQTLLSAV
eukprot:CAMPEP_0119060970 /NCGR_PEP_ID=MMETSP1178-20130426/4846_1 /TAXON_ID=33656 /ORGANISM="unid sp, Strain CCMP2000" /LENGTH=375 /DNA_ID=CAMNT_0007042133 /DNA_START=44 /DNA_END=1171 /DNA_ORIENTATION=+